LHHSPIIIRPSVTLATSKVQITVISVPFSSIHPEDNVYNEYFILLGAGDWQELRRSEKDLGLAVIHRHRRHREGQYPL